MNGPNDNGIRLICETGTEIENATYEWCRSRNNDIGFVQGEARTIREFKHGDWHVRVLTRTVLTSDQENFYLRAKLNAYENSIRIYFNNWYKVIGRNFL